MHSLWVGIRQKYKIISTSLLYLKTETTAFSLVSFVLVYTLVRFKQYTLRFTMQISQVAKFSIFAIHIRECIYFGLIKKKKKQEILLLFRS